MYWIKILETSSAWKKPLPSDTWVLRKEYQGRLSECGYNSLFKLGKQHSKMIERNETRKDVICEHTRVFSVVLQTLWLRQSAETSTFFGNPLVFILPNIHCVISCFLPPKFKDAVNEGTRLIGEKLTKKLSVGVQNGLSKPPGPDESKVAISSWLDMARKAQILSTFPRLDSLEATAGLKLTGQQDSDNGWVKNYPGRLYELRRTNSPYEQ